MYLTATSVTVPPIEGVVSECQRAYDEVNRQRQAHGKCVERQIAQCLHTLAVESADETQRSHTAAEANRLTLQRIGELKQQCSGRKLQALSAIQRLQQAGVRLRWRNDSCSKAELGAASALVGDIDQTRAQAVAAATQYTQNVQFIQNLGLMSIEDRLNYDRAYLRNKTVALASLPAEFSAISRQQSDELLSLLRALNGSLTLCSSGGQNKCTLPLQSQLVRIKGQYNALWTAFTSQREDFGAYRQSVDTLLRKVGDALSYIDLPDTQVHIPELHLVELSLPAQLDIDQLTMELRDFGRQRQQQAESLLEGARLTSESWRARIDVAADGVPRLFSDYAPPQVNTSEPRAQLQLASARFISEEEHVIDSFASRLERKNAANVSAQNATADLPDATLLSSFDATGVEAEPLHGAALDFNFFSLMLSRLVGIATLFDTAWRVYRSVYIVLKYWSRASLGMPLIDLRHDAPGAAGGAAKATLGALATSPVRLCQTIFLSPLSGAVIVSSGLFLLLNVASALYIPIYGEYVRGCVEPPHNGTFFTANLYSVSYNYAADDGNKVMLRGLDDFHSSRAMNCSGELRDSLRAQRSAISQLQQAKRTHAAAAGDVQLLHKCLDSAALDAAARGEGLTPWLPLGAMLSSEACDESVAAAELFNGVYNCSAMSDCPRQCDGPSRDVTSAMCLQCGCHAEWLGHGLMLRFLLGLFVFLFLNASRVLLVDAVCRMLWRSLWAGSFEYMANCDEHGHSDVDRKQRLSRIKELLRGNRTRGVLLLLFALALNLPWYLALSYVSSHLKII